MKNPHIEARKKELRSMSTDKLVEVAISHGLRDYQKDADKVDYPIAKTSVRQLTMFDILVHEFNLRR